LAPGQGLGLAGEAAAGDAMLEFAEAQGEGAVLCEDPGPGGNKCKGVLLLSKSRGTDKLVTSEVNFALSQSAGACLWATQSTMQDK